MLSEICESSMTKQMKLVVLIATEALTVIVALNLWIPLSSESDSAVSSNLMRLVAYI